MRIDRVVWLATMTLLLGLSFAGCGGGSSVSSQYGTDSFLPLTVGNHWVYEVTHYNTSAPNSPGRSVDDVSFDVKAPQTFSNGQAFPMQITSASDPSTGYRWNLKWDGNNLLKLGETYTGVAYTYQPPIVLFKNGASDDTVWISTTTSTDSVNATTEIVSTTFEMLNYERVTTAAGTFDALKVKSYATTGGFYADQFTWYAQGVGIVKMENYVNSPINGAKTLLDSYTLLAYTLAN